MSSINSSKITLICSLSVKLISIEPPEADVKYTRLPVLSSNCRRVRLSDAQPPQNDRFSQQFSAPLAQKRSLNACRKLQARTESGRRQRLVIHCRLCKPAPPVACACKIHLRRRRRRRRGKQGLGGPTFSGLAASASEEQLVLLPWCDRLRNSVVPSLRRSLAMHCASGIPNTRLAPSEIR